MQKSKRLDKRFQTQAKLAALRFAKWTLRYLPLGFIQVIMEGLFAIVYFGLGTLRRIAMINLKKAYGNSNSEKDYRRLTRATIKNVGRSMLDLLYYVEHPKRFQNIVSLEGEQYLESALKLNRGVIGGTAHLGNFALMFVALVQRGYKVNVIIRPMRDKEFSEFMYGLCAKWGINMIQTQPRKNFIKECLDSLRRNELLFILADEAVVEENGVPVEFFGQSVWRTPGPMVFHYKMEAPILPIFITKEKDKTFKISIQPAIPIENKYSKDENTQKTINTLTASIEKHVRKYPMQWGGWMNKRWSEN